ncbi:MAG: pantoate--beta-alanine ligase [Sinobacteraceae bacterium]|nr:pantoate--beta-alanine ligase [Nevskiaceae bacterium]
METVTTVTAVRERVRAWHREGLRVAFVPTMGNLHAGHVSLIEAARRHGDRFVASIFVNPMQFGPNEDFAHYPRTPHQDEHMLAAAGCNLMFMPDVAEIYPNGSERATRVEVPSLSRILCGEFRPGHFEGVTTVVATLFNIVQPDVAVFGEKDFQQLTVIRRMAADLCIPVQIIGAPTVRDDDGLAMSSRNQYLTDQERRIAPQIYEILTATAKRLQSDDNDFGGIERKGSQLLEAAGLKPDYFAVREAKDLGTPRPDSNHLVVLTAARLGKARLIDNVQVRR